MRARLEPILAAMLCAACALGPSASTTSPAPMVTASDTAAPGTPTDDPTPSPTLEPTVEPTPTATADLAVLDLRLTDCNGGVVLEWSPSRHPDFSFYLGFRSPDREIAPQYPPIAPAVDWGDLYATDPFVTSGFDASIVPSTTIWFYRVMAYDASGRVVSSSPVRSARLHPPVEMDLEVASAGEGRTRLEWSRFDGLAGCFSSYRVLYGAGGSATTLLTTVSDVRRTELETAALHPGGTYTIRIQAVRTTTMGFFVVGETAPLTYVVPASDP